MKHSFLRKRSPLCNTCQNSESPFLIYYLSSDLSPTLSTNVQLKSSLYKVLSGCEWYISNNPTKAIISQHLQRSETLSSSSNMPLTKNGFAFDHCPEGKHKGRNKEIKRRTDSSCNLKNMETFEKLCWEPEHLYLSVTAQEKHVDLLRFPGPCLTQPVPRITAPGWLASINHLFEIKSYGNQSCCCQPSFPSHQIMREVQKRSWWYQG